MTGWSASLYVLSVLTLLLTFGAHAIAQEEVQDREALEELGRSLFFDTAFSESRTISCASCHDPAQGFIDSRALATNAPVSLGGDGRSLGVRNAPTLSYVAIAPEFVLSDDGVYGGGFFLDGRARDLETQASVPLLHPDEMAIPNDDVLLSRLRESPQYLQAFQSVFGSEALVDGRSAVIGFSKAIAAFERSDFFAPFDSKYDRYLRGEYTANAQEQVGMALFFTPGFTSCNQCHQLQSLPQASVETFSSYRFENIGVPANPLIATSGTDSSTWFDAGLSTNPLLADLTQAERDEQQGKFKVPTLRNIALTGPYMHNGVFQDLRTVLKFYNKFNAVTQDSQTNPETGKPWEPAEVSDNIAVDKLPSLFLTDRQIDALMAFLRMLTDQRYESLLE